MTKVNIPKTLIDQIKDGQVILFLGSGASIGSVHPQGKKPPIGNELSNILAKKYLGDTFCNRSLEHVAELAISETSLFEVQSYISSIFKEFSPSNFHKMIPRFKWVTIATTNYDQIIERAYAEIKDRIQQLVVFKKNGERIEEKIRNSSGLVYLKLHGCISNIEDDNTPLILTPEQYITHRKGRNRLFERLQGLCYEYPILFVGHSLSDPDIRAIINEIESLGGLRIRSYLLNPRITDIEKRMWESKRFTCISSSFEDFMHTLDFLIPNEKRNLFKVSTEFDHSIQKKFVVHNDTKMSDSLKSLIYNDVDYVHKNYKSMNIDPKLFYKGYFDGFSPIVANLDVKRSISDTILSEIFLQTENNKKEKTEFFVLKGHAGSGKSVLLRRVAWDASITFDKLCLYTRSSANLRYEPLYELYRLANERIFLFVDPVNEYKEKIEEIINLSKKDDLPISIIGTERYNEWNIQCEELDPYVTDIYELGYLSVKEIKSLLSLLQKNKSLGHLENLNIEQQIEEMSKRAGRQLLVALHEATLGKAFTDIIYDEYQSITDVQAQSLYLTVCILHRIGVHTRAGLISRVHSIPFSLFKEGLFKPLEFVVFTTEDKIINDVYYKTRHQHIAEIVFERVLTAQQDRYDEYVRILSSLDVDYKADSEAFKGLMNAKKLMELFHDPALIRDLFNIAETRVSEDSKLKQQEAIFEMSHIGGNLNTATVLLEEAHRISPYDKAISHSLSILALKKSQNSNNEVEKIKYREESRKIANSLKRGAVSSHPFHTIIKIGLEELNEHIKKDYEEAVIERKIKDIEKIISEASQTFPGSEFILDAEAKYAEMIKANPKAIGSLKKAFSINKRSTYIASRLAKMYVLMDDDEKALKVLKECCDANPNDKNINFNIAVSLMKNSGDENEIKHHLRRSFTEGDSNFAAQFWYARLLYIQGDRTGSDKIFKKLSAAKIDIRIKKEPRGIIEMDNEKTRFSGTVSNLESTFGFIVRDGENDSIFSYYSYSNNGVWKSLETNDRVTFNLGFNYRGPFAIDILLE